MAERHDKYNALRKTKKAVDPDLKARTNAKQRAWRASHPENVREGTRRYNEAHPYADKNQNLKRAYGITLDDFCKIWANQDGKCANPLCNSILEYGKRGVHVDHDHETGKVRGLLCAQCNVALGQLEENANRMIGLATYILQHKDGCYD